MNGAASIAWWSECAPQMGAQAMDKLLDADAGWQATLASGRDDLRLGIEATGMRTGSDLIAVEIGCGLGRLTQALAEHFGLVVGVDVSRALLKQAVTNNERDNVVFEVNDGYHLRPAAVKSCDTVFSYEVLYYLNREILTSYLRDVFALLRPGGQFVFELNTEPIRFGTRVSGAIRNVLHSCGKKHWRGWPTGPGFRRFCHSPAYLRETLTSIGFRVERIVDKNVRQTWVVAEKPE